jgi:hypothetical protein
MVIAVTREICLEVQSKLYIEIRNCPEGIDIAFFNTLLEPRGVKDSSADFHRGASKNEDEYGEETGHWARWRDILCSRP